MFPGTTKHCEWFEEMDVTYMCIVFNYSKTGYVIHDLLHLIRIETSENGWTDDEIGF